MGTYVVTAPDGRKVKLTGDTPPTDSDLDGIFANLPPIESQVTAGSQAKKLGSTALGMGEAALSVASGIPAALGGGLAYLGTGLLTGDQEAAQSVKSGVEESMTYEPRSDLGQEYIGDVAGMAQEYIADPLETASETLGEAEFKRQQEMGSGNVQTALSATTDYMIPNLLVEAAGLLSGGGLSRLAKQKASKQKQKGQDLERQLDVDSNDYQGAADTIKKAKPEDLAELVNADPELVHSIEELELNADALASYYSKNPQYRAIEQGLASVDASDLNQQQKRFIQELSQKADNIIEEYGGSLDKSSLGDEIKTDMLKAIDDIYEAEDVIYSNIKQALPPQTKVNPENTLAFLDAYASELGGIKNLPPSLKKLHAELMPETRKTESLIVDVKGETSKGLSQELPNYGLLNDRRSQIGQQLGRGDSVFKNVEQGRLKALYAAMKRDQHSIIEGQGVESLSNMQANATALTKQRKKLESDSRDIMGKDLDKGLMEALGGAVKSLGTDKPKVDKFIGLVNKIPANRRQEAVLSAMNEAWKGTAASKAQLGEAQFARFWTAINRSPRIKNELFKNLPPESRKAITNLGKVTTSVYKANQDMITTGRIKEFLDDRGGVVNRLANKLLPSAAVVLANKAAPMVTFGMSELLSNSTDAAKAANNMLASSHFQRMITEGVKDGIALNGSISRKTQQMEKAFKKTKQYENWAETLAPGDKAIIARVGLVNYLIKPYEETTSENQ